MKIRLRVVGAAPEIMRFLLVGTVGFIVDATVLALAVHVGEMSRIWARLPSFLVAVTVTWWLHRRFTFERARNSAPSVREWLRFVLANGFGNGVNLCTYWVLIGFFNWAYVPALATASIIAAGINYGMSARWVFSGDDS